MGLQIRRRSSYRVRVISTVIAVLALAAQPIYGFMSYQKAHALPVTTVAVTPNTLSIDGGYTKTASADTSSFTNLKLSFHYNADKLEAGEQLLYGWGAGQGSITSLSAITGISGNHEQGDVTNVALPAGADISNLTLNFSNNGVDGASDNVKVNNISLTGTPSTSPAVVPVPNAVTLVSRTTNSITLNFDITQDNAGSGLACFDTQADAATTLPDNEKSICLPVGWNSPITFSSVNSWIQVRENLLDGTNTAWQTFDVQPVTPPADVTGPAITVTNPSTSPVSDMHDLVLSGTVTDPSGVADLYVRANDAAVRPARVFTGTATLNGSDWTLTVPAGTFQDGHTIQLQVFARDTLHNQSEKDITFTVDNSAPAVPSDLNWVGTGNIGATNGFTNIQKGTLSWKDSDPAVDHYIYKFWTNIPGYYDGASNAWDTESTGNRNLIVNNSIGTNFYNEEGTYSFCVEAVDVSGNVSNCSDTYSVTYDATPPTAMINAPALTNSSNPLITGVASDTGSGVKSNWFEITDPNGKLFYVNGKSSFNLSEAKDNSAQKVPITVIDGAYRIRYVVTDKAGNRSDDPNYTNPTIKTMVIDRTVGTPTISPASGDIKGNQAFTITAGYAGDSVAVSDSNGTGVYSNGIYSLDTTDIKKGTNITVTVTESDAAGNRSSITTQYTVDNSAMSTPTVSGVIMGHDTNGQYWLTGSSANSANSQVSVMNNGTKFAGPVNVNADGSWTVLLGGLPKSTNYNFTVVIANTLGYSSSLTQTFTTSPLQTALVTPGVTQRLLRSFGTVATPVNTATNAAPTVTKGDNTGILGAQTTKKGINDTSVLSPSSQGWKILGFAWYWWLILIAAIVALWYWLAAVRRRHADEAAYLNK